MHEFVISHDGVNWNIINDSISVSSPTIDALDNDLAGKLRERGLLKKGETAKIFMAFDNNGIPQWMRQYAHHYFNRIIEIKG